MSGEAVTVMSALVFCYALTARRLTFANVTAPMLSIVAGMVVFSTGSVDINADVVHSIAEITLVIVLFHDASTVRMSQLRHDPGIAVRLLLVGFPLALLATYLVAKALLPDLGWAGALVIAAAITPTDAGLGAPTVLNPATLAMKGESGPSSSKARSPKTMVARPRGPNQPRNAIVGRRNPLPTMASATGTIRSTVNASTAITSHCQRNPCAKTRSSRPPKRNHTGNPSRSAEVSSRSALSCSSARVVDTAPNTRPPTNAAMKALAPMSSAAPNSSAGSTSIATWRPRRPLR